MKGVIYKNSGFSLIDVIAGTLVSLIFMNICFGMMSYQYESVRQVRALFIQNVVLLQLRSSVSAETLASSALDPDNRYLKNCLHGVDGVKCSSTELYPVKIHNLSQISGFPIDPVGYDLGSQVCKLGSSRNCLFKLSTQFRVQCAEEPDNPLVPVETCSDKGPGLVEIFYKFEVQADSSRIVGLAPVTGSIILRL